MIVIYLTLIFEIVIEAGIIILISNYINQDSFFYHFLVCLFFFIISGIGALLRNEDRIISGRRYFMTLGHSTVWAFFIGILFL